MQGHAISGGLAGDTIGDQHCSVLRGGAGAAQPPQNTVEAAGEGDEGGEGDGCDAGLAPQEMGLGGGDIPVPTAKPEERASSLPKC